MRDRDSVNAMLAEVSGKKAADKLVSAKLKDQRAALATAVPLPAPAGAPAGCASPPPGPDGFAAAPLIAARRLSVSQWGV